MAKTPLVRLGAALSVGPPVVALLLWRKRMQKGGENYTKILRRIGKAHLRPHTLSVSENVAKAKMGHRVGGQGSYMNSLDTRKNHYVFNPILESSRPPTRGPAMGNIISHDSRLDEDELTGATESEMDTTSQHADGELSDSPGSEDEQAHRRGMMSEGPLIPTRVPSLAPNASNDNHGHALPAMKTPSFQFATPTRYPALSSSGESLNQDFRGKSSTPMRTTTPDGLPLEFHDPNVTTRAPIEAKGEEQGSSEQAPDQFNTRPDTMVDRILAGKARSPSISSHSDGGSVETDLEPALVADKLIAVPEKVHTPISKGGDNAPNLFRKMLASRYNTPDVPIQETFGDSGYGTGLKPGRGKSIVDEIEDEELVLPETPSKSQTNDTEHDLSLMRTPSESSTQLTGLSANKTDNLATKFAKLAVEYLNLGPQYLVEQSNAELNARQKGSKDDDSDALSINISEILTRICVCVPKMEGTPVLMYSDEFQLPTAAIEDDGYILLNMPEDSNGCSLRIEYGKNGRMKYFLDLSMQLVDSQTATNTFTLVSQIEITSPVEALAVQEYRARRASTDSARSFDLTPSNWIEQADIESSEEPGEWINHEETSPDPPSPYMRRLLAFIQTIKREHLECCIFSGKMKPGWGVLDWEVKHVSSLMQESCEQPVYEKRVYTKDWDNIQSYLDDEEDGFRWPQSISWGETGEPRWGYFVPTTDGRNIDGEQQEKWWLMFLSDFDEHVWEKVRMV